LSPFRDQNTDAAAIMGKDGNDSYLADMFSPAGITSLTQLARKSSPLIRPFPSALMNKNPVVSEINCRVEYVEQFTKHLYGAE